MRFRRTKSAVLLAVLAGCATGGPRQYGQYEELAPRVTPQQGERLPQHVTIQLNRPANVAVFLVMPGRGSTLLFPADSSQSGYLEAGPHLVETSYRRVAVSDSATRLIRRPADQGRSRGGAGRGTSGAARDTFPTFGFNQRGFLLVYASEQRLSYHALSTRVAGISIPIEDNDALNTVTKLIRSATNTTGPWAAYATDFPP